MIPDGRWHSVAVRWCSMNSYTSFTFTFILLCFIACLISALVVMTIIAIAALVICMTIICIGCLCLRRSVIINKDFISNIKLVLIDIYCVVSLFHCRLLIFHGKWAVLDFVDDVSSYKRDAMEKLKMSNGGTRDVYLSNSRCMRNNDKPVDNNVFTGRLPVSTGPQRHQWQQHQLLMQADDTSQNFFTDNQQSV